jgi:hypothetical protein
VKRNPSSFVYLSTRDGFRCALPIRQNANMAFPGQNDPNTVPSSA